MSNKILCEVSDLTPIADAVREVESTTDLYSFKNLCEKVNELIQNGNNSGVELPHLSNPASQSDVLDGKEFIDEYGVKKTGNIVTKTSNNLTSSGATVTVPAGYYASQATKSVATATQATPSVSIDANGKITASTTQTAGYVSAGTKTGTKQMTVQAAKTVTPTKSSQTAVAKNVYTTGVVTVAAIPDQYQDITTPLSELNAVNGGTAATTIGAAVDNTEAHASSQEALIAQIASVLEGKAGGEDVSAETAEYTEQLDELESTIDSLPDAGSGKKTVTITVEATISSGEAVRYFDELGTLRSIRSGTSTIEALGGALVIPPYTTNLVTQGSAVYESGVMRRLIVCREDGTTIQVFEQTSSG